MKTLKNLFVGLLISVSFTSCNNKDQLIKDNQRVAIEIQDVNQKMKEIYLSNGHNMIDVDIMILQNTLDSLQKVSDAQIAEIAVK